MTDATAPQSTIDDAEIARFSALAAEWWNPNGKFAVLHKFNPVRLRYIREHALRHFRRDPGSLAPFTGLRLLDIGCGGGLLSEPMARLGFDVLGADASAKNIGTASTHAREQGLSIDYRATSAEDLAAAGERFDVILNMEVVEHVADLDLFLQSCAAMLRPGGIMFVATLNRTLKSWALAIVGAEYVLGWLPRGTHDWNRFLKPMELDAALGRAGLNGRNETGVFYNPLLNEWSPSSDTDVNYMLVAEKPA
ncbi:MAG: bifunctional 2-polyprenyl-6-hydroxyphenol methylase/3-demethylubiquinol 3-O-methyltransferase UbiG [Alphaproteobacteria bacterium]|nr:bifunctional 2-polyprenyl-6-hydroxyphenol methylase/3-demethylubiquinol 3-O-methyltransferase UbiG [Alphaproteobacteria bacterium]